MEQGFSFSVLREMALEYIIQGRIINQKNGRNILEACLDKEVIERNPFLVPLKARRVLKRGQGDSSTFLTVLDLSFFLFLKAFEEGDCTGEDRSKTVLFFLKERPFLGLLPICLPDFVSIPAPQLSTAVCLPASHNSLFFS